MHRKLIRRLLWMFVFVIAISAAVIYFTFDIRALEYLTMFEPWCIAAAFGILGLGLVFDGLRLMTLAAVTDEKLTTRQVVNVVLSNYFLALVTPGASGGAVAQIMFMRKAGVPVAKATVVVFVRTIMSITFLILLVPFVLHSDHALVDQCHYYCICFICFAADCSSAAYEDQISGVLDHWVNEQFLTRFQEELFYLV